MTKKLRRRLLGAAAALAIGHATADRAWADGPFGISAGDDPGQVPTCHSDTKNPGSFVCGALLRPHPELVAFRVTSAPGVGACAIEAFSERFQVNSFGSEIRSRVDEIALQIAEKYGNDRKLEDYLARGSTWKKPEWWSMGLAQKERVYAYTWSKDSGARLPDRITAIRVVAFAEGPTSGQVGVLFTFDNMARCETEQRKLRSKAF